MFSKIALMGMSCVGKTTYAKTLPNTYISFDDKFAYNLSLHTDYNIAYNLNKITSICGSNFVLDNWAFYDIDGKIFYKAFPDGVMYLLYAPYNDILKRYRVKIHGPDAFRMMYTNMYLKKDFTKYQNIKYIKVDSTYTMTSYEQFKNTVESSNLEPEMQFNEKEWSWS